MTASSSSKEAIASRLAETRERTLELIEPLDAEQLVRVYSPLLSPLIWDLGHIANFEELWLARRIGGQPSLHGELGMLYDAIENPRSGRGELPTLRGEDLRSYLAAVRERTLEVLETVDLDPAAADPLLRDGFAFEMVIAHEQQHNETMLQLIQLVDGYEPRHIDPGAAAEPVSSGPEMVLVAGGEHLVGAPEGGFAYDNERRRHAVQLAPFEIDRTPVTNGAYIAFVEETGAEPPMHWRRDGAGGWLRTAMGRVAPVDPLHPVIHVSWHDARAFARWAGKRLPTEEEWEAACEGARPRRSNLDQRAYGTAPAGAYADTAADCGAVQMFGDVWEWTASEFNAYPGFEPFPYREYSEVFFGGGHRVLRGGSWATHRNVIRPSFRNWDLPQRRQIFAGFRCARDA